MKNTLVTLKSLSTCTFMLIGLYLSYSQDIVSDIQSTEKINEYHKSLIDIDGVEYLIEQNNESTLFSKLSNSKPSIFYKNNVRPSDEYKIYVTDKCYSSRPALYKDQFLFEPYDHSIYLTDILTGKIENEFHIPDSIMITSSDYAFIGDTILFSTRNSSNISCYYQIDLRTGTLKKLEFSYNSVVYRIDDHFYKFNDTRLVYFDITNNTEGVKQEYTSISNIVSYFLSGCDLSIAFSADGFVRVIQNDQQIKTIQCNVDINQIKYLYFRDSILTIKDNLTPSTFKVLNINNCSTVFSTVGEYNVTNIPELKTTHLVLSINGNYFINGKHHVLNTITKSLSQVSGEYLPDAYFGNISTVKDNKIYIGGFDDIELYGFVYSLNIIDLKSSKAKRIYFYDQIDESGIIFNRHIQDTLNVITYSFKRDIDYNKLTSTDQPLHISSLLLDRNLGIYNVYDTLIAHSKIFSSINNGIYVTDRNETKLLFSCEFSSKLTLFKENVFSLTKKDKEIGVVKINVETNIVSYKILEDFKSIDPYNKVTEYAIVNRQNASDFNQNKFYYDLESESLRGLKVDGSDLKVYRDEISGNIILVTAYINSKARKFLINTLTNKITPLRDELSAYFRTYPDNEGNFYITININDKLYLKLLKSDGNVVDISEIEDKPEFYGDRLSGLQGKIKTFPLIGIDTVLFFSAVNSQERFVKIPYPGVLYYTYFTWREVDETIIMETINKDFSYNTWIWQFGYEPKMIELPFKNYKLSEFVVDSNIAVIFYSDTKLKKMQIVEYDLVERKIVNILEKKLGKVSFRPWTFKNVKVGSNKFIINYNDGISGNEPWIYDLSTSEFYITRDLVPGYLSSDPEDYIKINDNVYFNALTPDKSRQWYLYRSDFSGTKEDFIEQISLYPNPSSDYVFLDKSYHRVDIYNTRGTLLIQVPNYKMNEPIDVSSLTTGAYFISAFNFTDEKDTSLFVKH